MAEALLHTINIAVPEEHKLGFKNLYSLISQRFNDRYPFRDDWDPHMDVLTQRVLPELSDFYIEKFKQIDFTKFKRSICLENVVTSGDGKYIFVDLDNASQIYIYNLREYILTFLGRYKDLTLPTYFKERWVSYTKDQQDRLLKTGSMHEYKPHMSLIKIDPADAHTALALCREKFIPIEFEVQLYMNREVTNRDNSHMFEKVADASLI